MLSVFDDVDARERIMVALDCEADAALGIAKDLMGRASWVKVGMTLFYATGPLIVRALKDCGFKVFLDLKFHDIPHQVEGAAYSAALSGADMFTMHASGGTDMMKAACQGASRAAEKTGGDVPVMLGITVLTSMNEDTLAEVGVSRALPDQVLFLAGQAQSAGLSGVVASPQEASRLREALGSAAYIVTPGIRPAGSEKGDQSRVTTPAQAFANGASHIVIGRPITQAASPAQAFDAIVREL